MSRAAPQLREKKKVRGKKNKKLPKLVKRSRRRGPVALTLLRHGPGHASLGRASASLLSHAAMPCPTSCARHVLHGVFDFFCVSASAPGVHCPPAPPPALNANARTRTRTSKCVLAVACRHTVPHILCTPCVAWRRGGGRGRGASASVPPVPPRLRLPLTSSATGKQDKEEGGSSAGSRPPPYAPGRVEAAQILKESVSYACTARSDDLLTFENVR
jgi:hypothetical protein